MNFPRFSDVFFIDTGTLGTIDLCFRSLAAAKQAGNTTEHALQWLAAQHTEWLLLFNNADNPDINLQKFFPCCTWGNIVITTRNSELQVHAPESHHRLLDMEESDAMVLLLGTNVNVRTPEEVQLASKIIHVSVASLVVIPTDSTVQGSSLFSTCIGPGQGIYLQIWVP